MNILYFLPILSSLAMLAAAVVSVRRVRGRTGRFLAILCLSCSLWALFIFLEYILQYYTEELHPEMLPAALSSIHALSGITGFFGQAIPFAFMIMALHFPPRTSKAHALTGIALAVFIVFGLISPLGLVFEIADGRVIRTTTVFMKIQSFSFVFAFGIGFAVLFRKHFNYTSRLRKFQIRWFGAGVLVSAIVGGILTLVFPDKKYIVLFSTLAPPLFIVTVFIGLLKARSMKGFRAAMLPEESPAAGSDLSERIEILKKAGYDLTLYRQFSGFVFAELGGHERITLPAGLLKPDSRFYWEDYDDNPESEEYNFLRRNYAEAGFLVAKGSEKFLVLIHTVSGDVVSERDMQNLKKAFE